MLWLLKIFLSFSFIWLQSTLLDLTLLYPLILSPHHTPSQSAKGKAASLVVDITDIAAESDRVIGVRSTVKDFDIDSWRSWLDRYLAVIKVTTHHTPLISYLSILLTLRAALSCFLWRTRYAHLSVSSPWLTGAWYRSSSSSPSLCDLWRSHQPHAALHVPSFIRCFTYSYHYYNHYYNHYSYHRSYHCSFHYWSC